MSDDKKSKTSQSRFYCRICLEETEPLKKLPCACKGSLSYMHDHCLNQMLHVKIENQKEDVPDYIQMMADSNTSLSNIKVNCQICLSEIILKKQIKLNWQKLMQVNAQIYIILIGICCLSAYGLRIALTLLLKVQEDDSLIAKMMYFGAHVWIIGVILYVMLEPLYSEIKVIKFSIQSQRVKDQSKENSLGLKQMNELSNNEVKISHIQTNTEKNTLFLKRERNLQCCSLEKGLKQKQKLKYYSKNKRYIHNVRYFQI